MTKTYDWIVIGGGITGSTLSYELVKKGLKVLLIEKDQVLDNATCYSYGGLAYWSGTTPATRQLCIEAKELYRNLSEELQGDVEFREIDLLLTIDPEDDPQTIAANYKECLVVPEVLTVEQACTLEPRLNPKAIAGGLKLPHGHIHPLKTNKAYQDAFCRLKGEIVIDKVVKLLRQGDRVLGVEGDHDNYYGANTVVCAGGLTRRLLREVGINLNIYFNHSQILKTPPVDFKLNALIMPSVIKRFELERETSQLERQKLWDKPRDEGVSKILDAGVIQFNDGSLIIGQITEIITNPEAAINVAECEKLLRQEIGKILPSLSNIPASLQTCLVAFNSDPHPLVGKVEQIEGVHLFSGFTSTLVFAPPLARHFAQAITGEEDLSRFIK